MTARTALLILLGIAAAPGVILAETGLWLWLH